MIGIGLRMKMSYYLTSKLKLKEISKVQKEIEVKNGK